MTLYQEEIQRTVHKYGCNTSFNEETNLLEVTYNSQPFVNVTENGYLSYSDKILSAQPQREIFTRLLDEADTVREYVGIYESAPQMKAKDVKNYRKFSEFGDTVFAGMYSPKHGFMFCSWKQINDGTYVAHGDYSPNYLNSKENFAVRSGLINKEKLFSREEAEELFKCIAFARGNCESLTYTQDRSLMCLMEKLQNSYPHMKDDPPAFDETEGMGINM